jgi:hypothetical protein
MSRRAMILLTVCVALTVSSGIALAATVHCKTGRICSGTNQRDLMKGTNGFNEMHGKGRADTLKSFGAADNLYGEGGNDRLNGGEGGDGYQFTSDNWGKDTITDTPISDTNTFTGNMVAFTLGVTTSLTINLVSDSGPLPEVKNADATSTVNWSGNVIDNVSNASTGNDTINGNPAANGILSKNGSDNIFAGGGSDLIEVNDNAGGDSVDCGGTFINPDNDTVYFDTGDTINANCENLNP